LPREPTKPIRAMETVMAGIHAACYQPPDWWEKWIDGQVQLSVSFEVASIGGEPHFYIRAAASYRDAVESSIYSQYPEAEINEVDDYTRYVPQTIPNKEWDLWATDYKLIKDDHYPIKTYPQFETERESEEEKRIDPLSNLIEGLAKIKPGEQFWLQFIATPAAEDRKASPNSIRWVSEGKKLRDVLVMRPAPEKRTSIGQEAASVIMGKGTMDSVSEAMNLLLSGQSIPSSQAAKKEKREDLFPPEMKLTPGERLAVAALENKMSKPLFDTAIRFIYLGKRDIFFKPNFRIGFSFFNTFTDFNLNGLLPLGATITKIHKSWFLPLNLLRPRRHYLRCRKIFKNYVGRNSPYFPRPGGTFMLNTEELASLFHPPSKAGTMVPGVSWVESKKGGGIPADLPTE